MEFRPNVNDALKLRELSRQSIPQHRDWLEVSPSIPSYGQEFRVLFSVFRPNGCVLSIFLELRYHVQVSLRNSLALHPRFVPMELHLASHYLYVQESHPNDDQLAFSVEKEQRINRWETNKSESSQKINISDQFEWKSWAITRVYGLSERPIQFGPEVQNLTSYRKSKVQLPSSRLFQGLNLNVQRARNNELRKVRGGYRGSRVYVKFLANSGLKDSF